MVAFLSILLAVVLLGVTVYGLHRYQTMEVEYTVDRSMPLPPLDAGDEASASKNDGPSAKPKVEQASSKSTKTTQTWLNRVAALKKQGDLQQALAVCEQEFPLWGAYNQACIIERLNIKDETASPEVRDAGLERLYKLAVTAELLHDKSADSEHLTLNQLKALDLSKLNDLEHDYQEIGYAHLRLIRKSDIKVMLAQWGRPAHHSLPRSHHQRWWRTLLEDIA